MTKELFEEFKKAVKSVCQDLEIDYASVKFDEPSEHTKATSLFYKAEGSAGKYNFNVILSQSYKDSEMKMDFYIRYTPGANPFNFECKPYGHLLQTFAEMAVYDFHTKCEPVRLDSLFYESRINIYGKPFGYTNPAFIELRLLLDGIEKRQKDVQVYRFRHVTGNDTVDYSYAFLISVYNYSFWAFFPMLAGLRGNTNYGDFLEAEGWLTDLSKKIKVERKNFDVEWKEFETFLSIKPRDVEQYNMPSIYEEVFGKTLCDSYKNSFLKRYKEEDYSSALSDLRSVLQDALEIACQKKGVVNTIPQKYRNIVTLMDIFIDKKSEDAWIMDAARAFQKVSSGYGSHSKVMIKEKLPDYRFKRQIVITILLGVQLLLEIQRILQPENEF